MSLHLNIGTSPDGLEVHTQIGDEVIIGDYVLTMVDFCHAVRYVMTNTDLEGESDPRIRLYRDICAMKIVPGYNSGKVRIAKGTGEMTKIPCVL